MGAKRFLHFSEWVPIGTGNRTRVSAYDVKTHRRCYGRLVLGLKMLRRKRENKTEIQLWPDRIESTGLFQSKHK